MRHLLLAALLVAMTGCGSDTKPEEQPTTPAETATQEDQPTTPAETVSSPETPNSSDEPSAKAGVPAVNSVGMRFVPIPAGEFMMGIPESDEYRRGDETQHRVTLTKPFYLSATEVTIGQFRQFVLARSYRTEAETDGKGGARFNTATRKLEGFDPKYTWKNSGFAQTDDHPVVNVSWNDAQAFCKWLSAKESVTYRLPTEAEWEYACRAGTTTRYSFGDSESELGDYTWYVDNSGGTHPVGQKKPNAWGLYDMHGNVLEWCHDWYGDYPSGSVTDPTGPASGKYRMFRGGSFANGKLSVHSAYRSSNRPANRFNFVGFRPARTYILSP